MSSERPLHLVDVAPPWRSGYTVRTHELLLAQRAIGMVPAVAAHPTSFLEPSYRYAGDGIAVLDVDGIPYYRRTDPRLFARACIVASQALVARRIRGARRFRRRLALPDDPWEGFIETLATEFRPTVVHAHTPASNFQGARRLARLLRIPTIYEVRGFWDLPGPGTRPAGVIRGLGETEWRDRELRAALDADAVITLGVAMRGELVSRGVPEAKIHIVGNGVDPDLFRPAAGPDRQLQASLDLAGCHVLGYVTSVNTYEGIDAVLHAVSHLRAMDHSVVFVLVGDGPDLGRLKGLAATLGVRDRVRFVGQVPHDQVRRFYSLFDTFIVPRADQENVRVVTPLKPLEAMAQAIPTVISDLPALRELVLPGERGWCFQPGQSEDLARVIVEMIQQPERTQAIAMQARDWVCRERSWRHLAGITRQIYAQCEAQHRP